MDPTYWPNCVTVRCPFLEGTVTLYKMTIPVAILCMEQEPFPANFERICWEEMYLEHSIWPFALKINVSNRFLSFALSIKESVFLSARKTNLDKFRYHGRAQ